MFVLCVFGVNLASNTFIFKSCIIKDLTFTSQIYDLTERDVDAKPMAFEME